MDKLLDIRNRWDSVYSMAKCQYSIRILGMVATYFSVYALLQFAPFREVINPTISMLIPIVVAVLFFIKAEIAVFIFGLIMWIALSGQFVLLVLAAGIICWFSGSCSRINCMIAVLTPLFIMNIPEGSHLLSLGWAYFVFSIGLYFANKVDNNGWKYIYAVYFSLLAFNFGLYGSIIPDYFAGVWDAGSYQNADIFTVYLTFADYEGSVAQLSMVYVPLLIAVFVNVLIAYIVKSLLNIKNISFLNMQMDLREAVVFGAMALLEIFAMVSMKFIAGSNIEINILSIVLQIICAYIITRPFASYAIVNRLQNKSFSDGVYVANKPLDEIVYSKTTGEELKTILETYINKKKYENIIKSDRTPVNVVLIFGIEELDKKLVLQNILGKMKLDITYVESTEFIKEFEAKKSIDVLEQADQQNKFIVIAIDEVDALLRSDTYNDKEKELTEYINKHLDKNSENENVFFIMTSSHPEMISDSSFGISRISKVFRVTSQDSILLNNTYRLIKPIGKGGAGLVYKAYHERLDVDVVVKKIINDFAGNISYKTEANVLKQLKHTYLPKIYDVFEEENKFYTVMDYISGSSLQEKLNEETSISQHYVLKWSKQLLEAVEYLHEQDTPIIHSDIKPGNIMLTPDGNISLIDFNISLMFDKSNKKGIGVSPGYSPIEQYGSLNNYYKTLETRGIKIKSAKGNKTGKYIEDPNATVLLEAVMENNCILGEQGVTEQQLESFIHEGLSERSDIYSIGATMYSMLTGEKPSVDFSDIKSLSSFEMNISNSLVNVIEKAMSIEPKERYNSAKEMWQALNMIEE